MILSGKDRIESTRASQSDSTHRRCNHWSSDRLAGKRGLIDDRWCGDRHVVFPVACFPANGSRCTGHKSNELIELLLLAWSRRSQYLCREAFSAHASLAPRPFRFPTSFPIENDYPTRSWVHSIVTSRKILVCTPRARLLVTNQLWKLLSFDDVTVNSHKDVGLSCPERSMEFSTSDIFFAPFLATLIAKLTTPLCVYQ